MQRRTAVGTLKQPTKKQRTTTPISVQPQRRMKERKTVSNRTCMTCQHWMVKKKGEPYCNIDFSKEGIAFGTPACRLYQQAGFFFCQQHGQRVSIVICKGRHDKKYCNKRCKQYKYVENIPVEMPSTKKEKEDRIVLVDHKI